MSKLRIGVVGLGNIAQKAWLPVLSDSRDWHLVGAFSPNQSKAQPICETYRIPYISSLSHLAGICDAVFVHSTTASHYEVVRALLDAGVDVCVDKPLAASLSDAEKLVALAAAKKRALMVGFNRRFAPYYQKIKQKMSAASSLRMDKHRVDSVGPDSLHFTLMDDYLHVVDTALWLGGSKARILAGTLQTNGEGHMLYAEHHFRLGQLLVTTSMHRRAGSQRETVRTVSDGGVYEVSDMRVWREECGAGLLEQSVSGWQSTLETRGFAGCARHFIDCVANQTAPETSGEQALMAQRIIETLWTEATCE